MKRKFFKLPYFSITSKRTTLICANMNVQNEFQAVILAAGKGSRMPEVTSCKPKCLLPIGGRPLVWYPLQKLQQSGFADVIMVVVDKDRSEIQLSLEKTELSIRIDYLSIPSSCEWGTAESLRFLADKIKYDVLIVSCDLITNMHLPEVLHDFRKHNAALCTLYFPTASENIRTPGPNMNYKPEQDLIGIDSLTNRLVFLASSSDFEHEVAIPLNIFRRHPNVRIFSGLLDAHFYVMKLWVLAYLRDSHSFATFKGEFLPHVIKQQFKSKPTTLIPPTSNASEIKPPRSEDIFDYCKQSEVQQQIAEANAFNFYSGNTFTCYAVIASNDVFGLRVNNLQAFWSLNREITTLWKDLFANVLPLPEIDSKSVATIKSMQIDGCFIWDGVSINEKTSFRNSIIGSYTQVESFTRITNSIIMNNAQIGERVIIENCIICDDVVVNSNCKLTNCVVGGKLNIPSKSEHANEVLTGAEMF